MDIKKIINPWLNRPEYNCFGCCPNNPIGLHMSISPVSGIPARIIKDG